MYVVVVEVGGSSYGGIVVVAVVMVGVVIAAVDEPGQGEEHYVRGAPTNERSRFQKREFMISHQIIRNLCVCFNHNMYMYMYMYVIVCVLLSK